MTTRQIQDIQNRLQKLRQQINEIGPIMRGTVVVIGTRNKQPYFSVNQNGRTRLIYLGKQREKVARTYAANHKKLLQLVDKITTLNMTLLKNDAHYKVAFK